MFLTAKLVLYSWPSCSSFVGKTLQLSHLKEQRINDALKIMWNCAVLIQLRLRGRSTKALNHPDNILVLKSSPPIK